MYRRKLLVIYMRGTRVWEAIIHLRSMLIHREIRRELPRSARVARCGAGARNRVLARGNPVGGERRLFFLGSRETPGHASPKPLALASADDKVDLLTPLAGLPGRRERVMRPPSLL